MTQLVSRTAAASLGGCYQIVTTFEDKRAPRGTQKPFFDTKNGGGTRSLRIQNPVRITPGGFDLHGSSALSRPPIVACSPPRRITACLVANLGKNTFAACSHAVSFAPALQLKCN
jgi:hypothetical protein